MGSSRQNALRIVLALALIVGLAFAPVLSPSSCMINKAEGRTLAAAWEGEFPPHRTAVGMAAPRLPDNGAVAAVREQVEAMPSPGRGMKDAPAAGVEPPAAKPSGPLPGAPAAARIDTGLPGPTNLSGTYTAQSGGNPRSNLSWTKANPDAAVVEYVVLRWDNTAFSSLSSLFASVAALEPSASAAAQSFSYHSGAVMQPGLTVAERQALIDSMLLDMDALFAIISASSQSGVWALWDQIAAAASSTAVNKSLSAYQDNKLVQDRCYLYVVVASYAGGDVSPPSNSWGLFAYQLGGTVPAQPTGFAATACDPGVALEWSPNLEMDLSGYNVYVLSGGTAVRLNTVLITQGTEHFHMTGLAGDTYYVEAVNTGGTAGPRASAVAVLAAATYYYADDPGWVDSAGLWVLENYISYGGNVIRVAQDPPSRTGITFAGRRVRLYCATYCQSGDVRVWVDGVDRGTCSLYSADITWGVAVFTLTGLDKGSHTIELECLGTGGVPIPHDPFDPPPEPVTRNFVNVQYLEVR